MRFDARRPGAADWLVVCRRALAEFDPSGLPLSDATRVLISGFGPFGEHASNATEALVRGLRSAESVSVGGPPEAAITALAGAAPMAASDRVTLPDGHLVQLVTAVLPTLWDTAAALLLKLARACRPSLIVMNGIADAAPLLRIETGAHNRAKLLVDATGQLAPDPDEPRVLAERPLDDVLPMRMDWQTIVAAAKDQLRQTAAAGTDLGVTEVELQQPGRPENAYVCNATSYAVLAGLRTAQPGKLLQTRPSADARLALPDAGPPSHRNPACVFLHWPSGLRSSQLSSARALLLRIVAAQLHSDTTADC